GEVLNGLVQEYAQEPGDEEDEKPNQIWCITPPGVDGYEKKIIFYLGVDNRRGPKRYAHPRAFYGHPIPPHPATARYLLLAPLPASREHLPLSYAQADDRDVYRPSPYLEQAAAVLGQSIAVPPSPALIPGAEPPSGATLPLQARRPGYTIAEVA